MGTCIIYNPTAGRGLARRLIERLRRARGNSYSFLPTQGPGHAAEIARQAIAEGMTTVIAAGGDGTVHEVANGILESSSSDTIFGVWPIGSANDYAFALGVDRNWPLSSHCRLVERRVDVGRVISGTRSQYFVNGLGLGFNAAVTQESRHLSRLRGMALYGLAFLIATWRHFHSPTLEVEIDGDRHVWPTLALTVNIGQREGGFLVTPKAILDDGQFDFVHAGSLTRWQALTMLPRIAMGTLPENHSLIHLGICREMRLQAKNPLRIHVDGEFFCQPEDNVCDVEIDLLPRRLRILASRLPGRFEH